MKFNIFGIEIERKTDILAFAAFVISIGSLLAQTINLIKGPEIIFEKPRQVLITSHKYPDGNEYTRISSILVYLNKGSPGYDDITKSEEATIYVGDNKIRLFGQEYIDSSVDEKQVLIIKKKSDAYPVQVKSGGVVVHETYFAPWPDKDETTNNNFIEFSEFTSWLKDNENIKVEFKIETFEGDIKSQTCNLVTKEFISHLEEKKWSAPVCKNMHR